MKNASRFISARLRFGGVLPVVATALSFFVIIVAVAVSSGFKKELSDALSSVHGDIVLTPWEGNVKTGGPLVDSLLALSGVKEVRPAVFRAGIVKNGDDIQGVMVKGETLPDTTSLGVYVPSRLCEVLSLGVGDEMLTYFISDKVKARRFTISGIYDGISDSKENYIVKASLDDMRRLCSMEDDEAQVLEVILHEKYRNRFDMSRLKYTCAELSGMQAVSIRDDFASLFDWLTLIDTNVLAILVLMIIVAGFNMISGLLIMLFRSISTIGTLKAAGMRDSGIASVFFRVGARAVLKGMLYGNALALLFCLMQQRFHLIRLDPDNYFLNYVPVNVDVAWIISCDLIAFAAVCVLLLIPCTFISRVDAARTMKSA